MKIRNPHYFFRKFVELVPCSEPDEGREVAWWLRHYATNRQVAGSIPNGSLEFFSDIILPVALWTGGRHSLQQKWVPGVFPGGKSGRCVRLTTIRPSCAVVMKSGNLIFLEPSWPPQTCGGTALPFIWTRWTEFITSRSTSLRHALILSSHLHIYFLIYLFIYRFSH